VKLLKTAVTTSETNSKNPIESTIAKEKNRCRKNPQIPWPGLGFTSQIRLREVCSWPTTPPAPNNKATNPMMVDTIPVFGFSFEAWIISWTVWALSWPIIPWRVSTI
jgi:hypothetical protein